MENQLNNNSEDADFKSDLLKQMKKENVFYTPENYFEKLPSNISDRIHKKSTTPELAKVWSPVRILSYSTLAVLIVVAGWFYFSNPASEKIAPSVLTYEDLDKSGIVSEMDETMLMEEYTVAANAQIDVVENQEVFKEYLIDNNTDITLIINELWQKLKTWPFGHWHHYSRCG